MKIQFLNGGLANQAFQYIFTRDYELSHPGEVIYMDDSYFALNTVHNGYELEKVFGIRPHMLSECFDTEVWEFILEERRRGKSVPQILNENGIEMYMVSEVGDGYRTFNPFEGRVVQTPTNQYCPEIQDLPDNVYYHGYWVNAKWFERHREVLLKDFTFSEITDERNLAYLEQIQNGNSVSLHIRRGDYVALGWSMNPNWYRYCIDKFKLTIPGQWELFIFSDDIPWCKEHGNELGFGKFKSVTYVEGNIHGKNYLDLQLMSKCKAMLMSNSAFCYLAWLLNVDRKYYIDIR